MIEYQWFYPKAEAELVELLTMWDYVGWHPFYHAVMLKRIL